MAHAPLPVAVIVPSVTKLPSPALVHLRRLKPAGLVRVFEARPLDRVLSIGSDDNNDETTANDGVLVSRLQRPIDVTDIITVPPLLEVDPADLAKIIEDTADRIGDRPIHYLPRLASAGARTRHAQWTQLLCAVMCHLWQMVQLLVATGTLGWMWLDDLPLWCVPIVKSERVTGASGRFRQRPLLRSLWNTPMVWPASGSIVVAFRDSWQAAAALGMVVYLLVTLVMLPPVLCALFYATGLVPLAVVRRQLQSPIPYWQLLAYPVLFASLVAKALYYSIV